MIRRRGLALPLVIVAGLAVCLEPLSCSSDPVVDTDGDGLSDNDELNVTGTSPLMADTDGDGLSDYEEQVSLSFDPENDPYHFNPLVADLPQMMLIFPGPPVLTLETMDSLAATSMVQASESDTMSVSTETSQTETAARSDTLAVSQTFTNSFSVTQPVVPLPADAGANARRDAGGGARDAGAAAIPAVVTLTNALSTTVSPATTITTSLTFSDALVQDQAVTLTRAEALAETHSVAVIAGILKVPVVIQNRSDVAFVLANLILGVRLEDPFGVPIVVQNLAVDEPMIFLFQPISLAPREQTDILTFIGVPLTLDITQAILLSGNSLVIRLAAYDLRDPVGRSFVFDVQEVEKRTALLAIDYGGQRSPELYQVATNADPAHSGITASKIFGDVLRIPYHADQHLGLTSIRGVSAQPGSSARWSVVRRHPEGPDVVDTPYGASGEPYDFDAIAVHAGDVLSLALTAAGDPAADAGAIVQPPLAMAPSIDGGLKVTTLEAGTREAPSPPAVPVWDAAPPIPPANTQR